MMSAHPSGKCKTPTCNKAAVRDGWCTTCSDYALQKQTIEVFTTMSSMLQANINAMQRLEQKIDAIKLTQHIVVQQTQQDSPVVKNEVQSSIPSKVPVNEAQVFIPSIATDTPEVQILDTKKTSNTKDVFELAKRLGTTE